MNTLSSQTDQSQRLQLGVSDAAPVADTCLYELGELSFGKYDDAVRQSSQIKSVVRDSLAAKAKCSDSGI